MSETTYHAEGDVRGSCGHRHKSIRAAYRCAEADRKACRRLSSPGSLTQSCSDRIVRRTDLQRLTAEELAELDEVGYSELTSTA